MRKTLILLPLLFLSIVINAQDSISTKLQVLFESEQYDVITGEYAAKSKDYPALSLFYIGYAYYMKADDNNCLKYIDLSIEKDPDVPGAHYIKGSTLNFLEKYAEAASSFEKAIALKPDVSKYYSCLGDSYYNLEQDDKALAAYKKALEQEDPIDRPYYMIGQIYANQDNKEKALEAYYIAKSKISKEDESYSTLLFNVGMFEYSKKNYSKSEEAFLELIGINPAHYRAYSKLIQVYYAQKQYDKAKPYRDKLYEAHKKGILKDNMEDMFCFDQFTWNGKEIQVYERFEEGSKDIYNKHLFYILKDNGDIDFRIQSEFSPTIVQMGGAKYILCMDKDGKHSTFNAGFNDDFKYEGLKKYVIAILEGKLKPGATSSFD